MERPNKQATVALLVDQEGKVCLARKKQAIHTEGEAISYSLGMYNGYGGKREDYDVSIEATAIREVKDECGVTIDETSLTRALRVYFYLTKDDEVIPFLDVFFFVVREWSGDPTETKEMGPPEFFTHDRIPYDEMMPADRVLFANLLAGEHGTYQIILRGKSIPPEIVKLTDEVTTV